MACLGYTRDPHLPAARSRRTRGRRTSPARAPCTAAGESIVVASARITGR